MSRIMRRKEVLKVTGLSASTQWREEKAGRFPARRHISIGIVGWLSSDVEKWLANRQAITHTTAKPNPPRSRRVGNQNR
jgi:prophage regulatory protein